MPLEAAQVRLARSGPLPVQQLQGVGHVVRVPGGLDEVYLRRVERAAQRRLGRARRVALVLGAALAVDRLLLAVQGGVALAGGGGLGTARLDRVEGLEGRAEHADDRRDGR